MRFYDALQLDPPALRQEIAAAETSSERRWWRCALLVRAVLLVVFAIFFISSCGALFGSENNSMAVVLFCILLAVRFVDFGYHIGHSMGALAVIFLILLLSPWLIQQVSPLAGFAINFVSLLTIGVLACEHPEMGNGGLYLFGYIFLTGSAVSLPVLIARGWLTLAGYALCGSVLFFKHRHKHQDVLLSHVVSHFRLSDPKCLWQLQLALGVSLLFLFGSFLHLDRFMWVGFACSSILSSYPVRIHERMRDRAAGVILGSLLFGVITAVLPSDLMFLLGPIAGLLLGLCTTYRARNLFNCFGALSLAATVYGLSGSIVLRICNNLLGIVFGWLFFCGFQWLCEHAIPNIRRTA